jgi:hypothetical protein
MIIKYYALMDQQRLDKSLFYFLTDRRSGESKNTWSNVTSPELSIGSDIPESS